MTNCGQRFTMTPMILSTIITGLLGWGAAFAANNASALDEASLRPPPPVLPGAKAPWTYGNLPPELE